MRPDLGKTDVGGFDYEFLRAVSLEAVGAALIGECIAIAPSIRAGDFGSWTRGWSDLAARLGDEGETAAASGHTSRAASCLLRASNYYRTAVFFVAPSDPRHHTLWASSRECFRRAAALSERGPEAVEIPYLGTTTLPGYFLTAPGRAKGTLVAIGGFDSTAEEVCCWIGMEAPSRGWNCLVFEGPGQWGALQVDPKLTLRPDYEVPIGAALDYLEVRSGGHLGCTTAVIGYSLGGLLAPRAAAFEDRLAGVIANSLVVEVGEAFRAAWPPVLRSGPPAVFNTLFRLLSSFIGSARWAYQHARWTMGIDRPHEFFEAWEPYTLRGLEERLTCPMLCLIGEDEVAQTTSAMVEATAAFLRSTAASWSMHYFTRESGAASHCQMGAIPLAQDAVFEWLDRLESSRLNATRTVPERLVRDADRYHGVGRELFPAGAAR